MSRTATFFVSIAVMCVLVGAWLLTDSDLLLALGVLAVGLTCLVFAHELSEHKARYDHSGLPEPETRGGRKLMLQVIGGVLAAIGAVLLAAQVV